MYEEGLLHLQSERRLLSFLAVAIDSVSKKFYCLAHSKAGLKYPILHGCNEVPGKF